ncbi:hypothetical protein T492DRAFT_841789 [Pavlovales sp. CCMP2436]|nr:hypothetical protein T492DRAFT_841789 [Pavlovales sp. CCMP2436]
MFKLATTSRPALYAALAALAAVIFVACTQQQREITFLPEEVIWPGFHPLCVTRSDASFVTVRALHRATGELRVVSACSVGELLLALRPVVESEYGNDDQRITASDYDFSPHPWALFSSLKPGSLACVYEGGQFLWSGWRIGHVTTVEVRLVDGIGEVKRRPVESTTLSLRPLVLELSGFLSDSECDYARHFAQQKLVLRYKPGQKYSAHGDYFSANEYHQNVQMLRSVEYGERNRLATDFW